MFISNCEHLRDDAGPVRRFIKTKSRVSLLQTEKYIKCKNFSILTLSGRKLKLRGKKVSLHLILCTLPLGTSKD